MSLTFSRPGMTSLTFEPIPGSLRIGGDGDDRGGSDSPRLRAGLSSDGSCRAILDSESISLEQALSLASPIGEGDFSISGDASSSNALVDIAISGSGTLSASISWKGSPP